MPLYYGITNPEDIPAAVELIQQKGLCCGVYMAYFVLKTLVKIGRKDLMTELLQNDSEHSWKNMLREDATTCFEAWGKDQKDNTSLCHPWASAPIILLLEDVAGLHADAPGVPLVRRTIFPTGYLRDSRKSENDERVHRKQLAQIQISRERSRPFCP